MALIWTSKRFLQGRFIAESLGYAIAIAASSTRHWGDWVMKEKHEMNYEALKKRTYTLEL